MRLVAVVVLLISLRVRGFLARAPVRARAGRPARALVARGAALDASGLDPEIEELDELAELVDQIPAPEAGVRGAEGADDDDDDDDDDEPAVFSALRAARSADAPAGDGDASASERRYVQLRGVFREYWLPAPKMREGEPFLTLPAIIAAASAPPDGGGDDDGPPQQLTVKIENRGKAWRTTGGFNAYGEIVGYRNRADGDRWDVFAPGLQTQPEIGAPLALARVLGVILIRGGNHKLVIELAGHPTVDVDAVAGDIARFVQRYPRTHRKASADRVAYLSVALSLGDEA
jgi:hypothetical protein